MKKAKKLTIPFLICFCHYFLITVIVKCCDRITQYAPGFRFSEELLLLILVYPLFPVLSGLVLQWRKKGWGFTVIFCFSIPLCTFLSFYLLNEKAKEILSLPYLAGMALFCLISYLLPVVLLRFFRRWRR